jgi:hypothetical protein
MDNFIQELEEDLRRDRYTALWRKYGRYAVALALVVVIAVAVGVVWREYRAGERMKDSLAYNAALALIEPGAPPSPAASEGAMAGLRAIGQSGSDAYATLARLQEAGLLSKSGKTDEAVAIYDAMAADSGTDSLFRDLARVLRVLATLDKDDPQQLTARLAPLTEARNPWRYSAIELTALLAQRGGDAAKARDLYTSLADDPTAPRQLRARAAEMLAVLGAAEG